MLKSGTCPMLIMTASMVCPLKVRPLASVMVTLHISGMKLPVEKVLLAAGALEPNPALRLYRTDAEAVQALRAHSHSPGPPDPHDLPAMAI